MPPFRLGLIADIQYADCDDGTDFSGQEHRYFRNSINIARRAVDCWNALELSEAQLLPGLCSVVQLGDIIDGCNSKLKESEKALKTVLQILSKSSCPRYDLIGNHELYNLHRDALERCGLRCGPSGCSIQTCAHLGDGWEGIFLDPFEVAQVLAGAKDWFAGLPHEKHRYVPYNGGLDRDKTREVDTVGENVEKSLLMTAGSG
eukprot:Skav230780  [mRNA]  locus=scaffold1473:188613:191254:- [translate_table: standard]